MTTRSGFRGASVVLGLAGLLVAAGAGPVPAQDGDGGSGPTWAALYGGAEAEEMEGVWATSDGGFIVAGLTDSYGGRRGEAWLLRLAGDGSVVWQKTYGGRRDDMLIDVRETDDGGFVAAGWTESFGARRMDMWVIKLDADGEIQWERSYGGRRQEQAWSVEPTVDGGYVIAGGTNSFGAGKADFWVLKLDADGDVEWERAYGGRRNDGGGGTYGEFVVRVLEDEDGNFVVASDTFSFGHGGSDIWVLKLDPAGEILWQRAYGGNDEETVWSIQEAADGGYIVPGASVSFAPDYSGDLWVLKLRKNGRIRWQRTYGMPDYWDEALSLGATSDGGALVGGYFEEGRDDWDLFLLRIDARGEVMWRRDFEYGWDWPNAIQELPDGGHVVAGVAWPADENRPEDLLVMRLGPDGHVGDECPVLSETMIVASETRSRPRRTRARVTVTRATVRDTRAVVRDSTAVPQFLCDAVSAGDSRAAKLAAVCGSDPTGLDPAG